MERGDIYHVDLNPIQGREQAGRRYVLIVSPRDFNRPGTPLVCPITQGGEFARSKGFAVSLSGTGTNAQGVVLCNQPRVLDLQGRKAAFVEKVPQAVTDEVIARLLTLLE
ncbi:type II toxin-antitoxin system PemK/MazF family toxin [Singulisphaera sp. PoT]|uniref:type II toxin-antitoxin system PemK/MazF family toxin n=1 Tax=Singulisphaera sp. PoT TaxID=3411797 RepID=UPI003BF5292B